MKHVNKNIFFRLSIFICFVLLSGCSNIGGSSDDNNSRNNRECVFKGTVSYSDALPSEFVSLIDTNDSRSALPLDFLSGLSLYVKAQAEGQTTREVTAFQAVAGTNEHSFEIALSIGYTWKISVYLKNSSGEVLLSDTFEKEVTVDDVIVNKKFVLRPQTTGTGNIDLSIDISSVVGVGAAGYSAECHFLNSSETVTTVLSAESGTVTISKNSIPAGVYDLSINLKDSNGYYIYSNVQTICVFNGLTTNTWVSKNGGPINNNNQYIISSVEANKIYYVGSSGDDSNSGSPYKPFKTLQRAINAVVTKNNGLSDYFIYLLSDLEEGNITCNATANLELYIEGFEEKRTVNANGSSASPKRVFSEISGTNLNLTLNNLVLTGGYAEGNGAVALNVNSGSVTLNKVDIVNNLTNGKHAVAWADGSSINITSANIYDNKDAGGYQDNVYVENGKTINIKSNLSGCKIGITTASAITAGSPLTFTTGFSLTNTSPAGTIFFSDSKNYGVITTLVNQAALSVTGGDVYNVIEHQKMTFSCDEFGFYPGVERQITIKPVLTINGTALDSTDESWNKVGYSTWLTCDGIIVTNTGSGTLTKHTVAGSDVTILAEIPASVIYEDKYVLHVKTTFNDVSYNEEFLLKGIKDQFALLTSLPEAGTYNIASVEGLRKLTEWNGSTDFEGYTFKLTKNIDDASGIGNIGTSTKPFKGTFEGNGHSVSVSISSSSNTVGLFAYVEDATIKNLIVEGSINVTGSSSGQTGGIIGQADGNSKITNCINRINIISSGPAAGIVGFAVNSSSCVIDGCINEGNVTSGYNAGGIIASGGIGTIIRNCGNKGNVTSTIYYASVGGISSQHYATIYNCYNLGDITVENPTNGSAGGLLGQGSASYVISNCYSNGLVKSKGANISGNSSYSSLNSKYNYFTYPTTSAITEGVNTSTPSSPDPYCYKCTITAGASAIASDITVGSYTGKDVVTLLNAWVDKQSQPSDYKHWKYDSNGNPVFVD